jgi:hypothetical protein
VTLHPKIVRHDLEQLLAHCRHVVRSLGRNTTGQIEALHAWVRENTLQHDFLRYFPAGDTCPHGTGGSQVTRQRARVDAGQSGDAVHAQVLIE